MIVTIPQELPSIIRGEFFAKSNANDNPRCRKGKFAIISCHWATLKTTHSTIEGNHIPARQRGSAALPAACLRLFRKVLDLWHLVKIRRNAESRQQHSQQPTIEHVVTLSTDPFA